MQQFESVRISEIQVERESRQRREIKVEDLVESIRRRGLINPITVERESRRLIAGERRLTACLQLGWTEIPVRWFEDLSPVEAQLLELEENLKRSDLEWRDIVDAVARVHELNLSVDPEWTMGDTAESIGLQLSTVSMYLRVRREMESNERVSAAGTVREAYNVIQRIEQRRAGDALQELAELPPPKGEGQSGGVADAIAPGGIGADASGLPPTAITRPLPSIPPAPYPVPAPPPGPLPPADCILHESFLKWAPAYSGPKFTLLHCDFPYGVGVFNGPQGRGAEPSEGYDDSAGVYWELVDCLCDNLDRLMSVSSHLMFWLSADMRIVWETLERFRVKAPSLEFHKFPLVWMKSDNAGIAADVRRLPRHVYEVCLLASRGKRQLVQLKADAYHAPTDKKFHPSTKPVPVLKHFMTMLVDEHSKVLDPTCGSGAALRAAEALGARSVLGLEINEEYASGARKALAQDRALRGASEVASRRLAEL